MAPEDGVAPEDRVAPAEAVASPASRRIEAAAGGVALIAFFACTEVLPFASAIRQVARRATAHLLVLVLPSSMLGRSALWLLVPAALLLFVAALPMRRRGLQVVPLVLFVAGMSFFAFAMLLPHPTKDGPIWSLFGLAWLGGNLWADDLDFFYASVVALFLWDMGSGAQALSYHIRALSEPYGNGIPPAVVVVLDSAGVVATLACWRLGLEPKEPLRRIGERFGRTPSARR